MQRIMTVREAMHEKEKARKFWDSLNRRDRFQIGDDLVLGQFDFRDWGFDSKPSRAFVNEIDYQRMLWEDSDASV